MILYHGGTNIVESPRIITESIGRDFGVGFYLTDMREQAIKWAKRQAKVRKIPEAILNVYEFDENLAYKHLSAKTFDDYTMEWLDLVVSCRKDSTFRHGYDLVSGKIANDDVGETVQTVVNGLAPKEFALTKLKFMSANNQICFCSVAALQYLTFTAAERLA
jgi:hypothetical protein